MSEATIYRKLIDAGLTPEGACALMGNMECESNLVSYRVQGDFSVGYQKSKDYTLQIDNNAFSEEDFVNKGPGGGGYGLCQWTYPARKRNLYRFAKQQGKSIGDEDMQVDFCLQEFPSEAPDTFRLLKSSTDMRKCVEWVCKWYERPAVNNFNARYDAAEEFYNKRTSYGASSTVTPPQQPMDGYVTIPAEEYKRLTTAATVLDLMLNIQALVEDYKR